MDKQKFANALRMAFPGANLNCSPDFWNFKIELNGNVWKLYVSSMFVKQIENGVAIDKEIVNFKNSNNGDYLLTIDPRLPDIEHEDGNGLLILLPEVLN